VWLPGPLTCRSLVTVKVNPHEHVATQGSNQIDFNALSISRCWSTKDLSGTSSSLEYASNVLSMSSCAYIIIPQALQPHMKIGTYTTVNRKTWGFSVDTNTEAEIHEAFQRLCAGRSTFIIAHRLSAVVNADQILVVYKDILWREAHISSS
jgi:hypothetical protein